VPFSSLTLAILACAQTSKRDQWPTHSYAVHSCYQNYYLNHSFVAAWTAETST